jgi:hypothetical protein
VTLKDPSDAARAALSAGLSRRKVTMPTPLRREGVVSWYGTVQDANDAVIVLTSTGQLNRPDAGRRTDLDADGQYAVSIGASLAAFDLGPETLAKLADVSAPPAAEATPATPYVVLPQRQRQLREIVTVDDLTAELLADVAEIATSFYEDRVDWEDLWSRLENRNDVSLPTSTADPVYDEIRKAGRAARKDS